MRKFFCHRYVSLSAIALLPAFLLLAWDLLERRGDMPPLVALRLDAASRMLGEQIPYIDFFDWSNPIVFDLSALPLVLLDSANKLSCAVRLEDVVQGLLLFAFFASIVACLCLLVGARESLDPGEARAEALAGELDLIALPYLAGLTFTGFFARFQFGDLQFLLVLTLAPWLLMRWLAYQGVKPSRVAGLATGVFAALGAALDLPNLLALIAVELSLLSYYGRLKPPASGQWRGVALGGAALAFRFLCLPTLVRSAYWYWIVPLKLVHYQEFDANLFGPHASPDLSRLFYLFCAAVTAWVVVGKRLSLLTPLLTLSVLGLGNYILEKEGYTRDALVMAFAVIVSLSLVLALVLRYFSGRRPKFVSVALCLIYLALAAVGFKSFDLAWCDSMAPRSRADHKDLPDIFELLAKRLKNGSTVMILADIPEAIYPIVTNLDLHQSGYLLWARPMKTLNSLLDRGALSEHWKTLNAHIVNKLTEEFKSGNADMVVLHGDIIPDFLFKSGCQTALDSRYKLDGSCFFFSDNRSPREYIGFNHAYTVFVKKP